MQGLVVRKQTQHLVPFVVQLQCWLHLCLRNFLMESWGTD